MEILMMGLVSGITCGVFITLVLPNAPLWKYSSAFISLWITIVLIILAVKETLGGRYGI